MAEQSPNTKEKKEPWLGGFVKNARQNKAGDVIAAEVGAAAQNVAVGKNIIQIGSIQIPRYVAVVLVAGMVIVAVAAIRLVYMFLPETVMPGGSFNIAVAALNAFDPQGKPIKSEESVDRAKSIAKYLDNQEKELTTMIGQQVLIWGPDQNIDPVLNGTQAEVAKKLNTDVLIYGELHQYGGNQWLFHPSFYLSDSSVGQAYELQGEYALGKELLYQAESTASTKDLNTTLQIRLEALSQMLLGMSYLDEGTEKNYDQAIETFEELVDKSAWARINDNSGQEILYHFLGNAYQIRASHYEDGSPERRPMMEKSKLAFLKALELNPTYVRSYNGLGVANFQLARPMPIEGKHICEWDWKWDLLDESKAAFEKALLATEESKPKSGLVNIRSHFGLGRIHHVWGICPVDGRPQETEQEWVKAHKDYQVVLDAFQQNTEQSTQLTETAAYAHTDLGVESLIRAQFRLSGIIPEGQIKSSKLLQDAIQHFQQVITLTQNSRKVESIKQSIAVMPLYLNALCTNQQGGLAKTVLSDFLKTHNSVPHITNEPVKEADILEFFENLDVPERISWKECTN